MVKDMIHLALYMDNFKGRNKMYKKIISLIILIIIVILILFAISPIFVPKWVEGGDNYITNIVRGFYAEKDNTLDVMFMGNSDMYRGMSPIMLWDEYGIASYSYTSPGQRAWTGYYVLLDALRSQKPDIIVFNMDEIQSTVHSTESCYRKAFDNMQMSSVKLKALNDPTYNFSFSEKISYIFPIFRYHSRVTELTREDFKNAYGYEQYENKGLDMITKINPYNGGKSYMDDKGESYEFPEKTKKYIDKIVETCEKEEIKLILVEIPSADSWSYAKSQAISKYAEEKKLPFIDFNLLLDEIDFDWTKDTPDGGDHINVFGAEKVTKYMGKYLKDNYNLSDRRKDEDYSSWFDASKKYHQNKENMIKEQQ